MRFVSDLGRTFVAVLSAAMLAVGAISALSGSDPSVWLVAGVGLLALTFALLWVEARGKNGTAAQPTVQIGTVNVISGDAATPQPQHPPRTEDVITGEVKLGDLVQVGGKTVISGKTFRDAHIWGPAVIVPLGAFTLYRSSFGSPTRASLFWTIPEGQDKLVGVIGIEDCVFERCTFRNVAIAGPRHMLDHIAKGIEGGA
ncbi:MAG TPA: hypothetical protein VHF89_19710 [Solirubrobacteraceae bacterium]|nr:hypothetical protein [Solirubrobacteraceae bacterium]